MGMIPFITQTYEHRSRNVGHTRTVNMYPEITQGGDSAKSRIIYVGTAGTEIEVDVTSITEYGCRGLHYTATSRLFGVFGGKVIEFDIEGNATLRAEITNIPESPVYIADDGNYLMMVDGINLYAMRLTSNTMVSIDLPEENFRPSKIVYIGSRFVMIDGESNTYYWSEVSNPLDWRALNSANASQSEDPIISIEATQNSLWLMGTRSYEVHSLSPNVNRPYVYSGGSSSDIGCGASRSVAVLNNSVFFLGGSTTGDGSVYMSNGYNVTRISNHSIEYEIGQLENKTNAVGFTYTQEGHQFYVLTFIDGNKTLVYDVTTNMWHERSTRDASLNIFNRWSPIYACYAFGETYVGNLNDGYLMSLNLDKYDEWDSRPIVRLHESPVYWEDLRTMFHREFTIDMETGVGLTSGQGENPKAMLQFSDDSGYTWSSELWSDIGALGKYETRATWRRLGRARARVYRLTISDPVKITILGARLIAEKGARR